MHHRRRRDAFTLIELLIVVAIIGLLVSILMPSLSGARRKAQGTVCLSNIQQTSRAFFLYALDNGGSIPGTFWQGPINLDWSGRDNDAYLADPTAYRNPFESSVLAKYVSGQDRIMECPLTKRGANGYFDYTVIIRLAGIRTEVPWKMLYPLNPASGSSAKAAFIAMPFLVEEDEKFYNDSFDDGSFAANDQFTDRHEGGAHVAYLDGSVSKFISPKGPHPTAEEPNDLIANHLRLSAMQQEFAVGSSTAAEFGWANHPR